MSRAFLAGSLATLLLALAGCSSSGRDPQVGEPSNTDIQQVRIGNHIVDFNGQNLVYLDGAGRVRIDVNQEVNLDRVRETLAINLLALSPLPEDSRQFTGFDVTNFGRLELISRELGIFDWIPFSGSLAGLQPGVPYRMRISSFYAQVGNKPPDGIGLSKEEFDLIPLSRPRTSFTTKLQSDGLINRIFLGNTVVDRRDNEFTLVALDSTNTVQVDLATDINPATFEPGLQYELVINNLTRGESFSFGYAELIANGEFSFPDANNAKIVWTKTSPGGLASFVNAGTGGAINVSSVGDELELRIDRVSGLRANGDRLTLRDRSFRVVHIFGE